MVFEVISGLLLNSPSQVACVALLYIAHARAERESAKTAAAKGRRSSIISSSSSKSSSSSSISAFDIQATVHLAAVLQRLVLMYNVIVPAVMQRCCQVTREVCGGVCVLCVYMCQEVCVIYDVLFCTVLYVMSCVMCAVF